MAGKGNKNKEIVVGLEFNNACCSGCIKTIQKICEKAPGVLNVEMEDEGDGKGLAILTALEGNKPKFDVDRIVKAIRSKTNKFVTVLDEDEL